MNFLITRIYKLLSYQQTIQFNTLPITAMLYHKLPAAPGFPHVQFSYFNRFRIINLAKKNRSVRLDQLSCCLQFPVVWRDLVIFFRSHMDNKFLFWKAVFLSFSFRRLAIIWINAPSFKYFSLLVVMGKFG